MENPAVLLPRLAAVLVLALPAVYFLVRGLQGGPRSRRMANLALFCGLTVLVIPETSLGLSPAEWPRLFLASGGLRVLLASAGIVLALSALGARRDGGVGVARPLIAVGFSLLHLLVGGGHMWFSSFAQPSTPWVYQSPDRAYRLTLPSHEWKESPPAEGGPVVAFVRQAVPRMQAAVPAVNRQQTEADFVRVSEALHQRIESNPRLRGNGRFREGTNAAGNKYHYLTGMDSSRDGKPLFVAWSVTWCPRKQIVIELLFQGLPGMMSEAGKAAEMNLFEKSAETICLSVDEN